MKRLVKWRGVYEPEKTPAEQYVAGFYSWPVALTVAIGCVGLLSAIGCMLYLMFTTGRV